jgi:hypothetical protein
VKKATSVPKTTVDKTAPAPKAAAKSPSAAKPTS